MTRLDTLLSLIEFWKDRNIDGVLSVMHEDIVWHYAAAIAPPVIGRAKARRLLESLAPGIGEVRWRIFDYAERDETLFVEGVDEYVSSEGRLVSAPYAGVALFKDGLIIALREYFDLSGVTRMKEGDAAPQHVRELIARNALKLGETPYS
jgi:ketosteroid isomerase-like protein